MKLCLNGFVRPAVVAFQCYRFWICSGHSLPPLVLSLKIVKGGNFVRKTITNSRSNHFIKSSVFLIAPATLTYRFVSNNLSVTGPSDLNRFSNVRCTSLHYIFRFISALTMLHYKHYYKVIVHTWTLSITLIVLTII